MAARAPNRDAQAAELLAVIHGMKPARRALFLSALPVEDKALVERAYALHQQTGWRAHPAAMWAHLDGRELWPYVVLLSETFARALMGLLFRQRTRAHQRVLLDALALAVQWPAVWDFLAFLLAWGIVVVGDSPQFSALNAENAPRALVGSALTIANCIGFAITIGSIELLNAAAGTVGAQWLFVLLAPGPILGLVALLPLLRRTP